MARRLKAAFSKWGMWSTILMATSIAILVLITVVKSADATNSLSFEAESMKGSGTNFSDNSASKDRGRLFTRNSGTSRLFNGAVSSLLVRSRGESCNGAPRMMVKVDGRTVMSRLVKAKRWNAYTASIKVPAGSHRLTTSFTNDRKTRKCDRNLRVDKVSLGQAPAPAPAPALTNPFSGEQFYANNVAAKQQVEKWSTTDPAAAQQMQKIARNPVIQYFSTWSNQKHVDNYISTVTSENKLPVIGIYAIPYRDCGSYSAGGFSTAAEYRTWIGEVAAGIGGRKAVVIVEPDAVAGWDCLSASQKQERIELLGYAVQKLKSNPETHVYIDAGNPTWHPASETASRLRMVNIGLADGFTLNHSNFQSTANNISYGKEVSALIGGKHFVVDTSRNGLGPTADYNWCNPEGRALGRQPTADTGEPLVDAFFWLKTPGESDGACGGYPGGGTWLPDYALGLADRAAY